ncbi:MAG: hypothetical protein ACM3VT_14955 [Solirubrobacterales bacterium]
MQQRLGAILAELKAHAPFTLFGSLTGIAMMLLFRNMPESTAYNLFYVFHPLHVTLSAVVAGSIFRLHERARSFLTVLLVGYVSSVGVATLSNSVIPFFGESILGVAIPTESEAHGGHQAQAPSTGESEAAHVDEHQGPKIHLGFIEEWYIVNPAAFLGLFIGYLLPRTKLPHAGHILVSTWASAAHILMNMQSDVTLLTIVGMCVVLFIAVWVPCCTSDIIFPMFFVRAPHLHSGCCCHHHDSTEEVHA